jgi:SPFH/Band 7/PHB domain protein
MIYLIVIGAIVLVSLLAQTVKVVNQYERGVVLTLGRYTGTKQPGIRILVPIIQRMIKVDVRSTPIDVAKQEVITKDNVTAAIDAVVYIRVLDAQRAVLETTNYVVATSQFAQAALRDVTGNAKLDEILSRREEISQQIKKIVDEQTSAWGVDVEIVRIQNIELPKELKRAMAKQAEAERDRRATIISADGEKIAAQNLADAAKVFSGVPGALNLRTLATLERIATEPSQKTMMLFPVELIDALRGMSAIKPGAQEQEPIVTQKSTSRSKK